MSKLDIKNATTADISVIGRLAMDVWPQTYTPIIGSQQVAYMLGLFYNPAELQKQIEEPGHRFIICYSDLQPVGFASWSQIQPDVYKLHKIYILPDQQGKGTGRYMMEYIVAEIKAKRGKYLRLNVNRFNYAAKTFYTKTGFKRLGDEDIAIGNGYFMNDHILSMRIEY